MRLTAFALSAVVVVCAGQAAAAPAWKRLGVEKATSSSYLQSNWNKYDENYHPNYVLDDNPKTAWVEGVEGNGEDQTITLPFSDLRTAKALKIVIWNGYQKSPALLKANAAPQGVHFIVRDAVGDEVVQRKTVLAKKMGAQEFVIDIPAKRGISSVTMTVVSTHDGSAYKDGCVSDIAVYVDSDVAYEEAVEKKKMAAAKAWIKERVTTAKAFAARPKTYPFASTHFAADGSGAFADEDISTWPDDGSAPQPIAGRVPLGKQIDSGKPVGVIAAMFTAAELKAFGQLSSTEVAGTYRLDQPHVTPAPDGLDELSQHVPSDVLAALAGPGATFFEGTTDVVKLGPDHTRTRFAVVFNDKDKKLVKRVSFREHVESHEREDYVADNTYQLEFDDKGLLTSVLMSGVEQTMSGVRIARVTFERDGEGRVKGVTVKSASGCRDAKEGFANTTWTGHYTAQQPGA